MDKMKLETIEISINENSYSIEIGKNFFSEEGALYLANSGMEIAFLKMKTCQNLHIYLNFGAMPLRARKIVY